MISSRGGHRWWLEINLTPPGDRMFLLLWFRRNVCVKIEGVELNEF